MPLNDRQQRFVEAYLIDPCATRAASTAGYSPRTARSQGQRLLTKADIAEAIAAAQKARADKVGDMAEDVLRSLKVLEAEARAANQYAAAIRAAELRGKHLGMFADRVKLGGDGDTPPVRVEAMTRDYSSLMRRREEPELLDVEATRILDDGN